MKNLTYLFLAISVALLVACSNDSEDDLTDPINSSDPISYNGDVKVIIDNNCISCHGNPVSNGAPMPLTSFAEVVDAVNNRGLIGRMDSNTNTMPPSGKLPQTIVDIVKQWEKTPRGHSRRHCLHIPPRAPVVSFVPIF